MRQFLFVLLLGLYGSNLVIAKPFFGDLISTGLSTLGKAADFAASSFVDGAKGLVGVFLPPDEDKDDSKEKDADKDNSGGVVASKDDSGNKVASKGDAGGKSDDSAGESEAKNDDKKKEDKDKDKKPDGK